MSKTDSKVVFADVFLYVDEFLHSSRTPRSGLNNLYATRYTRYKVKRKFSTKIIKISTQLAEILVTNVNMVVYDFLKKCMFYVVEKYMGRDGCNKIQFKSSKSVEAFP